MSDLNENDLISRQAVLSLAKDLTLEGGIKHRCVDATEIKELPSVRTLDVLEAYYKGKCDGIKECTARLKKVNEEFING